MEKRPGSIFKNPEVIKICDEMRFFHEILMVAGSYFDDVKRIEDTDGNAFLKDVNFVGIKTITEGMLEILPRESDFVGFLDANHRLESILRRS